MSSDLHYLSLDEVARRLKARKLSSVEATRAILDRIERLDPKLKSYATVTPERALQDAARLDAETAAGKSRGALHGVPIAVKDLCNTAGVPTAAGMAIHRQHVPARDATVVARLKQAGAVILGKLQMTEGAYGLHHPTVEPPVNPWNAGYWPGVSSSGSGVATASGLCFASLGSDTGGSIRFPSTMNGLSGLKPTWGRVSRAGVFPLAESLDHIGPMCRSALDSALVLGVIAGADPDDPTASPRPVPDYAGSTGRRRQGQEARRAEKSFGHGCRCAARLRRRRRDLQERGRDLGGRRAARLRRGVVALGAVVRPRGGAGARGDLPVAARRIRPGPGRPDRCSAAACPVSSSASTQLARARRDRRDRTAAGVGRSAADAGDGRSPRPRWRR